MTVQLAVYKGRGLIGNALVRWWTGSIYSHCELVIAERCYSASLMDGGVRRKWVGRRDSDISLAPEHWDLIDLPWADASQVIRYFNRTDHYRYGWGGLVINQLLNRNRTVAGAQFCSEWCAQALGLPNPASYSPSSLFALCKHLNKVTGDLFGVTI